MLFSAGLALMLMSAFSSFVSKKLLNCKSQKSVFLPLWGFKQCHFWSHSQLFMGPSWGLAFPGLNVNSVGMKGNSQVQIFNVKKYKSAICSRNMWKWENISLVNKPYFAHPFWQWDEMQSDCQQECLSGHTIGHWRPTEYFNKCVNWHQVVKRESISRDAVICFVCCWYYRGWNLW